ncbi:hypothetical protein [Phaeodactylibacter sp.]|uniref:hypothetical protein n=1 Tax=Phaeodactylibacter sp. TaxID=1940289 RepID=UPI0025EBA5F0|nr:hypothetical protein [Phaeodactylibacter sp.]MCI4650583.1 hypothetical protein [Phaeodactylibacter sp.]MCI5092429.1 hypothetical protein [Phaeodactylibacter sp.]
MRTYFWLFLLLPLLSTAQEYGEFDLNRGNGILFNVSYAYHSPGGDLGKRFGDHFSVGSGLEFITDKGNWLFGLGMNYYFGNQVAENPILGLLNDQGGIIGNNRGYADIQLRMRGYYLGGHVGKLIPLGFSRNPRSGLRVTASAGLLQHKIRIQDDPLNFVPQLDDQYKKGYDRLSNGLAFTEFIGYQILSTNKLINFFAGVEFTQGFTMSRRAFDFASRQQDTTERVDLNVGFRVGWILPFYVGERASEEIYY